MNARYAKFSPQLHDQDRENVRDPPSPQNPNSPPLTEIQQVMSTINEHRQQTLTMLAEQDKVLAEQNRITCSNWILIANDIAHNKALFIDHKTKIDQAIQDLTVRITRLETGAANSIQPPTQNSTQQPHPRPVDKMCFHCDQIAAQGLKDVTGQPFTKKFHIRKKTQTFTKFAHPENCSQFMSLSASDREKVLGAQQLCVTCAGKHEPGKLCSLHWTETKRPKQIRCCYFERKKQCNYHIILCKQHVDFNIKELRGISEKLDIPRYPVNHHKLGLNVDNSHLEPSGVLYTQSSAPLSTRDLDPDHGRALVDPEDTTRQSALTTADLTPASPVHSSDNNTPSDHSSDPIPPEKFVPDHNTTVWIEKTDTNTTVPQPHARVPDHPGEEDARLPDIETQLQNPQQIIPGIADQQTMSRPPPLQLLPGQHILPTN